MSEAVTPIYLRTDRGRMHRATVVGDQVQTAEACNLDDAAGRTVITSLAEVELGALCERCFPPSRKPEPEPDREPQP
jgi:hypothetical protein